jgi:toxin ParE1/3/4
LRPKPVKIHPAAFAETEAAVTWYRVRSERAAQRYLDELSHAIERISNGPGQFPLYTFGTRLAPLMRFPYLIVFRETPAAIEIVAIAHGRRVPNYRKDRVH